jgi:periplasmic protein TonB
MFERTLTASWNERSRCGLTTVTSLAMQAVAVAVLLIVPLLRPTAIPLFRHLSTPISLSPFAGGRPEAPSRPAAAFASHSSRAEIFLRQPSASPNHIPTVGEVPAPLVGSGPYISGIGDANGTRGVLGSLGMGSAPPISMAAAALEAPVRLSHRSEGDPIHKVLPIYPPLARSARIQGTVVLQAMISKRGIIENLRLLSGHPPACPGGD